MAHVNELIDFTVGIFIVYDGKVLLIHHKKLNMWLPIGGHVELDEDPEQALYREIEEECGLEVEVIGKKPDLETKERRFLLAPTYLDIHAINERHQHIGMVYFGKAKTGDCKLAEEEHNEIKWFSKEDLEKEEFGITDDIKFYFKEALRIVD